MGDGSELALGVGEVVVWRCRDDELASLAHGRVLPWSCVTSAALSRGGLWLAPTLMAWQAAGEVARKVALLGAAWRGAGTATKKMAGAVSIVATRGKETERWWWKN